MFDFIWKKKSKKQKAVDICIKHMNKIAFKGKKAESYHEKLILLTQMTAITAQLNVILSQPEKGLE